MNVICPYLPFPGSFSLVSLEEIISVKLCLYDILRYSLILIDYESVFVVVAYNDLNQEYLHE